MIGRAHERRLLRERVERRAGSGGGGLLLIGGEAGIGKTTLLNRVAADARERGFRVLSGQGIDQPHAPPYGLWRDILSTLPGVSGLLLADEAAANVADLDDLFQRIETALRAAARERPAVILLDDLQWADPASFDLLRYVARRQPGDESTPLIVATHRIENGPARAVIDIPRLARDTGAERIDLAGLNEADLSGWIASRYPLDADDHARLVAHVQARAAGNPFFVAELLRALESSGHLRAAGDRWIARDLDRVPVPPSIRQIIELQLAPLDATTRRLLDLAATIGDRAATALLAQIVDDASDSLFLGAIDRATAARLIEPAADEPAIAFRHALIRETLYLGQPLSRRRGNHLRIAETLARHADPPAGAIAAHFAAADDPRAIEWLVRAGEDAQARYAPRDAIAALTRAQEVAARFGQPLPRDAFRLRAAAYATLGEFDQARRDHESALTLARAAGDTRAEWRVLLDLGMLWTERDYLRSAAHYRAALDLARATGDPGAVAASLNHLANWHANAEDAETATRLHEEALALFERLDDAAGIAETLDFLAMARYLACDLAGSTHYCERAITALRGVGDRRRLASCLITHIFGGGEMNGVAPIVYRESSYWLRSGEEALAIAREIGWTGGQALALFGLSLASGVRGDPGGGLPLAEESAAIAERLGHHQWIAAGRLAAGLIHQELLDLPRAIADLERSMTAARFSRSRFWQNGIGAALALARIEHGDLDGAGALLASIPRSDQAAAALGGRAVLAADAALALARGDAERALAIMEELRAAIPNDTIPFLAKIHGDILAALDRPFEAETIYRVARDSAALFGFLGIVWRIDAMLAALATRRGDTMAADAARAAARRTVDEIAATIQDEAARKRFQTRAHAALPAPSAPKPVDRLSTRERDVLRLIVEGKSDREIAADLSISHRTVMRHVTGILTKLGVSSRTAAATVAIRTGIV